MTLIPINVTNMVGKTPWDEELIKYLKMIIWIEILIKYRRLISWKK